MLTELALTEDSHTFLFISKIHPSTEIWDRNLSPSKVVTFLYLDRYMSLRLVLCMYVRKVVRKELQL